MTYVRQPFGGGAFEGYVSQELDRVGAESSNVLPRVPEELHEEPKPRERLIAFADGTDWDPGSGKGLYIYYGAAWHKLG